MNYTKKGIHEKQKSLHATSTRLLKKGLLAILNLFLIAVLACGIIGASLGIGIFKGVIDTAPSIEKRQGNANRLFHLRLRPRRKPDCEADFPELQPYSGDLGYDP